MGARLVLAGFVLALALVSVYGLVARAGPKTPELHTTYGLAYYERGELDRALQSFNDALALEPAHADAYHGRGLVYERQNHVYWALADFGRAISLAPEPHYYLSRARLYRQQGELELAIADLSTVLSLSPEDVNALIERGNAYYSHNNRQAATADYERALRLEPQLAAAHYNLGLLAFEREDWDDAIRAFSRVLSLDETHILARCLRGQAYAHKDLDSLADFELAWGRRLIREQVGDDLATFMRYSSFCLHPALLD